MNEADIPDAQPLPDGVEEFVDGARETISSETGTPEEKILFTGLVLHFIADGKPVTFEVLKKL